MRKLSVFLMMMGLVAVLSGCPEAPELTVKVQTLDRDSFVLNAEQEVLADTSVNAPDGALIKVKATNGVDRLTVQYENVLKISDEQYNLLPPEYQKHFKWNSAEKTWEATDLIPIAVVTILSLLGGFAVDIHGLNRDQDAGYEFYFVPMAAEVRQAEVVVYSGEQSLTFTLTGQGVVPSDTTAPMIRLDGGTVTVNCGDTFIDPGFTATDDRDGDITDEVVVNGTVNTDVVGDYILTYTVADAVGNNASPKTRLVRVVGECPGEGEGEDPEPTFSLSYDYVPNFNDPTNTVLRGQVTSNVEDLGPYAVGTFLFIPGVGWAGPFPGEGAQPDLNGRVAYNIVGHNLHYFATKVRTIIVRDEVEMPTCNVCNEPPLVPQALAVVEADRSSQAQPEIVLDYVPDCRDESNTVLSGYVLDVAPHPNAVVAYLDIPEVGWSGPFPGLGGFIEEDGYFAFNVVGHPSDLTATRMRLFVVPDWVESPTCNTCTQAPFIAENLVWTDVERDCPPEEPVNQAPTIRLNGSATVQHPQGQPYTDPGATAIDSEDGDISGFITVGGSVNVNTPGVYTLRYNVRDSQGLSAPEITRIVTVTAVAPPTPPTIGTVTVDPDSGEVTVTFDGWTEEGAALVKLELLAEINFADEPWLFWGLVTKPGDLEPHYFAVSGPSITLTYNQDFGAPIPRDWTARRLVIRLLTANAVTQFLNTDTAIADGDPLNLPNLTSGQVLESAAVDIGTKQATLSGAAYYNN